MITFLQEVKKNRNLIYELTKREVTDRYLGQIVGIGWAFIHPLFQIGIILFLYGFILQPRMMSETSGNYVVYILSGLVPWLAINETLGRSATCISGKASLVKQVIFPIQILPVVASLVALVPQFVGFSILFIYEGLYLKEMTVLWILLPFIVLLQTVFMIGLSYFISALGVYFKDIKDIIVLFTQFGIYLAPIVYYIEWIPVSIRKLIYLNPFTHFILCYQDIIYRKSIENVYSWITIVILAFLSIVLGLRFFNKMKVSFGTVL